MTATPALPRLVLEAEERAARAGFGGSCEPLVWKLLACLTDGPTTEGDLRMLMELRVGLAAEGVSGPARVVDCDVPEPVDPEVTEWLGHLAHERLQRLLSERRPLADDPSSEDR